MYCGIDDQNIVWISLIGGTLIMFWGIVIHPRMAQKRYYRDVESEK